MDYSGIRDIVERFCDENGIDRCDMVWLTADEWEVRHEPVANGCLAVALIEGTGLSDVLNRFYETEVLTRKFDRWNSTMDSAGVIAELGYSWTLQFYPIGKEGERYEDAMAQDK